MARLTRPAMSASLSVCASRFPHAGDSGQRAAGWVDGSQQRCELQNNNDAPNAGHESGDHRVGHQADIAPELEYAEADLKQPGHDDHRESQGGLLGVVGQNARHDHRHGAGGSGDLTRGTAEQRGQQTDENSAVYAGYRSGPEGHAERQGQRQGDHRRSDTAVKITVEIVES